MMINHSGEPGFVIPHSCHLNRVFQIFHSQRQ
jgi:hypothetical protein